MKLLILISIFTFTTNITLAQYTNSEGILTKEHDQEFQNRIQEHFYTGSWFDTAKAQKTIEVFKEKREALFDSVFLYEKTRYINNYLLSDEAATKKALKRIKKNKTILFAFDLVIKKTKELIENHQEMTAQQIKNETADIMMFLTAAHTIKNTTSLWEVRERLEDVIRNFYKLKLDDKDELQASNLIDENGNFLSQKDLLSLRNNGEDISKLNPPTSAFWTNNEVEEYEPLKEEYKGKKIFPNKGEMFHYERFGKGAVKIKAYYEELDEGEVKERDVTIKIGKEVNSQLFSAHLARAVGYPAIPMVFRKDLKMKLGKRTYNQFIQEWKRNHGTGDFNPSGQFEYDKENHAVVIKECFLEVYPKQGKKYVRLGPFRSGRNGFRNRREYRALVLYMAMIGAADTGDRNIRVDAERRSKKAPWKPIYFLNDTGYSMGTWYTGFNPLVVNEYPDNILWDKGDKVWIKYFQQGPNPKTYRRVTASDLKWLARRFSRLSHQQLVDMGISAGIPQYLAELYAEKIKRRLNNMISLLKLEQPLKELTSYEDMHKKYPTLITKKGKITDEADNIDGKVTWYNGFRETLGEIITVNGVNFVFSKLDELLTLNADLLKTGFLYDLGEMNYGSFKLGTTRQIDINRYHGQGQKRFLVVDTYKLTLPLGYAIKSGNFKDDLGEYSLPAGMNIAYTFKYYHSYKTLKEASKTGFFKRFNPWIIKQAKDNLKAGETIHVTKSLGFNLGSISAEYNDDLKVVVNALKYTRLKLKEVYLQRYNDNSLDAVVVNSTSQSLATGFDFSFYIGLGLNIGANWKEKSYRYYHFDLENTPEKVSQEVYEAIVEDSVSVESATNVDNVLINESIFNTYKNSRFFIWRFNSSRGNAEIDFVASEYQRALAEEGVEEVSEELVQTGSEKRKILTANYNWSRSRDLSNIWNDQIDLGTGEAVANFFFGFIEEGKSNSIKAIGLVDSTGKKLDEIELSINIHRKDNFSTPREFNREIIKYFSKTAGEKKYFNYETPEGVKYYSPISATQKWQISAKGINQFIKALANTKNDRECNNWCKAKVKKYLKTTDLKEKLKVLVRLVRSKTKKSGKYSASLRKYITNDNLWITTQVKGGFRNSLPLTWQRGMDLFAKEVGKFQGHNILKRLNYKYNMSPMIDFGVSRATYLK